MTESKQAILSAIRGRNAPAAPLADLKRDWIRYDDAQRQFAAVLESVGGRCVAVASAAEISNELAGMPAYREAGQICSTVPGVAGNVDLPRVADPHELESIDFAILPGEFAVAENGAVWVTDEGLPHRVVFFIAQHLALVVRASEVVDNMHQAYERLRFSKPGFGAFISGPSKTADIEQSLVIGAHGARSLTVFLLAG
ncbi:MAG TPA: LUD domain-containing protein [Pirellulales bacterium]|nr:LUD domain-containing protein [Pirellulales bacterium]